MPPKRKIDEVVESSNLEKLSSSEATTTCYLVCNEGTSNKFYEVSRNQDKVMIRYGRIGTDGVSSNKEFAGDIIAAEKFVTKTIHEKTKKGYSEVSNDNATMPCDQAAVNGTSVSMSSELVSSGPIISSGNLADDLENGQKVFIKGSSAMPYTLKKFDGGYSCSCPGWTMNVRNKGIQATSCKHLRQVRGAEAELERCEAYAAVVANPSSKSNKNNSIPAKISLAQQWTEATDPTGYLMSEKLDGMRAYWCGKKLWSRSGLPIIAPEWFLYGLPQTLVLDGELFLGRQRFDECMMIARRTDASENWKQLRYVVFDAPTVTGGIVKRLEVAEAAMETALVSVTESSSVYWELHPQKICLGMEHLVDELARIEAVGGEGLMLRDASAPHRGGRSNDLLKVKSFHDDEALVTAHEEGKGKYCNMVGSLVCVSRTGAMFKVGSGLTDSMRSKGSAPAPGTVISFKYFELTKDGVPRFPTFLRVRPDVNPSEFPTTHDK